MPSILQAAVIEALDARRGTPAASGQLAPDRVTPYAGELLDPDGLIRIAPAVMVELDRGVLARAGASSLFTGAHSLDVICAARNAATGASWHEGAALVAWTVARLREIEVAFENHVLHVDQLAYRRYAMDKHARTWTGVLTASFSSIS